DRQAQNSRGLEVDHQLELCRLLDGKIRRSRALEDLGDKGGRVTVHLEEIHAKRKQRPRLCELPERCDDRQPVPRRKRSDADALGIEQWRSGAEQSLGAGALGSPDSAREIVGRIAKLYREELETEGASHAF